jgi:hypothetical protein
LSHVRPFAAFDAGSSTDPLHVLSRRLLDEQKESWPQLARGYASLDTVEVREVRCRGFTAFLQFNPGRVVSTAARVDEMSLRERPCFLCVQNLPPSQKGILYKGEFLVLCNPAPIFPQHFTISSVAHVPQALEPTLNVFLDLARDLSPKFTVFYNGPRCGASAPDHMHFQASPTGAIPVERDAQQGGRRVFRKKPDGVSVITLKEYGRTVLVLESGDKEKLAASIRLLLAGLREMTGEADEPMLNVLCSFDGSNWRAICFPRRKHRPEAYFKEGEEKVLISPAAVDMGGLIITPMKRDFERADRELVEGIFREVTVQEVQIEAVIDGLQSSGC